MGVIIGILVSKYDDDKVGRWLGIILGTVLNTELGNCEGLSLYSALVPILVFALGGWCMTTGDGTKIVSHYWCPCYVWIFSRCIIFGNQTRMFLICLSFHLVPGPSRFNNNKIYLNKIPRVWLLLPKSAQTAVPVKHFIQPTPQLMQYPMWLGVPQQMWKNYVPHKSGTHAEGWMCWCPKWFFKGLHPKLVSPFLNASRWMKTIHAGKTQTLIWSISNIPGEQQGCGHGGHFLFCWMPCNE